MDPKLIQSDLNDAVTKDLNKAFARLMINVVARLVDEVRTLDPNAEEELAEALKRRV